MNLSALGHHFGRSGTSSGSHFGGVGGFWLPSASLGRTDEYYTFPGARFWVQLGLPNRAKFDQKSMQNPIKKMMLFKIDF